ncbi:MAG: ATP phosphoribosyltransferase regulatory subunit [Roseiflexaceae bacterium]
MDNLVDAVRGMRDVLPDDFARQQHIAHQINHVLSTHGYQAIELPLLEHRDLYVRKLGEELAGKIYEFSFNGRDLALRPEWTASVLRAYISKLVDQPVPLRLRYTGPVFRYERPQRGTWRQFTQIGGEMIGAPAPRADAEVLGVACAGLHAVGIREYHISIGHIGIIRALLGSLGVSERTRSVLTWSLERMRNRGVDVVRDALMSEIEGEQQGFDTTVLAGLDDAQAEDLLLHTLRSIGVNLQFGTRPPEEIVRRLVRTLRTHDQRPTVERAIAFLAELSVIRGAPAQALADVTDLITRYQLPDPGLAEVRALIDLLAPHGVDMQRVTLDFGIGRGLHYYTGMMFEIDDLRGLQLCGGGRYDELVGALGGKQSVPAVGFSYGLERVVLAAPAEIMPPAQRAVVVAWEDVTVYPYALEVAQLLRAHYVIAICELRERPLSQQVRDAQRRDQQVVFVQAADVATRTVQWRDQRQTESLTLDALVARCGGQV